MNTTCYLILRGHRRRYEPHTVSSVKVIGVRAGRPALNHDEAAIKLVLDIPDEVFDPAEVAVTVEPRSVTLALEIEDAEPIEELVEAND